METLPVIPADYLVIDGTNNHIEICGTLNAATVIAARLALATLGAPIGIYKLKTTKIGRSRPTPGVRSVR